MRKRTLLVTVKATPEERQKWNELSQAAGMTLADLIRQRLDAQLVGREPIRQQRTRTVVSPALLYQVCRMGNNLNQVARACNRWKNRIDAVQVIAALLAIERALSAAVEVTKASARSED